jgi:AraC-like DNA-binding protein
MSQVLPGVRGFPLGKATKIRCVDPSLAECTVGSLVEPRRFQLRGDRHAVDIRISHVSMGLGHLFGVSHGVALVATSAPISSYQVMVPLRGRLVGNTAAGEVVADPGTALVYSPRDSLDTYWSEDCTSLVLSVPAERLRALARDVYPAADASNIRLRPLMRLADGAGRSFANALGVIAQESIDPESAFRRGLTTQFLEQTLLLSLIAAQGESMEAAQAFPPPPAYIGKALAVIEARCDEDIGMADLVRAAGVSMRTLQYGFLERFGVGPMTYLRQKRLRRVHDALRQASPGSCKIGDMAARWGFFHGSAFANAYRKMFGELPSQTLAACDSAPGRRAVVA